MDFSGKQPRRKFLSGLLASAAGVAALILTPKRARAVTKAPPEAETGPILYRRGEETERYYRTLYR